MPVQYQNFAANLLATNNPKLIVPRSNHTSGGEITLNSAQCPTHQSKSICMMRSTRHLREPKRHLTGRFLSCKISSCRAWVHIAYLSRTQLQLIVLSSQTQLRKALIAASDPRPPQFLEGSQLIRTTTVSRAHTNSLAPTYRKTHTYASSKTGAETVSPPGQRSAPDYYAKVKRPPDGAGRGRLTKS
jgi:hypothetical protein